MFHLLGLSILVTKKKDIVNFFFLAKTNSYKVVHRLLGTGSFSVALRPQRSHGLLGTGRRGLDVEREEEGDYTIATLSRPE